MPLDAKTRWEYVRAGRVRILWLVLGALLLVSALPIGLYHRQVLQLSQEKLVDTERVQQTDLTRSLAQEIQLFEANLTQQLLSERQILALTGLIDNVEDPSAEPKVTRLLEEFVSSNRSTFLYLTAIAAVAGGQISQRPPSARAGKPARVRRGGASRRRQPQLHRNAGRGCFPGRHRSPVAGSQCAWTHCFSGGSQRPSGGALGHQKLRSWRRCQQQCPCGASESAAAGASQHGNRGLYPKGQETRDRDDRNVQHFS